MRSCPAKFWMAWRLTYPKSWAANISSSGRKIPWLCGVRHFSAGTCRSSMPGLAIRKRWTASWKRPRRRSIGNSDREIRRRSSSASSIPAPPIATTRRSPQTCAVARSSYSRRRSPPSRTWRRSRPGGKPCSAWSARRASSAACKPRGTATASIRAELNSSAKARPIPSAAPVPRSPRRSTICRCTGRCRAKAATGWNSGPARAA